MALSRVTNPEGVSMVVPANSAASGMIKNVVWLEIFTDPYQQQQQQAQELA